MEKSSHFELDRLEGRHAHGSAVAEAAGFDPAIALAREGFEHAGVRIDEPEERFARAAS